MIAWFDGWLEGIFPNMCTRIFCRWRRESLGKWGWSVCKLTWKLFNPDCDGKIALHTEHRVCRKNKFPIACIMCRAQKRDTRWTSFFGTVNQVKSPLNSILLLRNFSSVFLHSIKNDGETEISSDNGDENMKRKTVFCWKIFCL